MKYRAPKHIVRCVMIVRVERRCTGCTNERYSRFETTCIYKHFNGGYMCVLIVRVQNCERAVQKRGY